MLHIVEIRHIGADLPTIQRELDGWLERHRIQPASVEHSLGGPGITFRVQFAHAADAAAFAKTFHGWLNDGYDRHAIEWTCSHAPEVRT